MESCFVCHSYIAPRSGNCPSCGTQLIIRRRAVLHRRNTLPVALHPILSPDLEILESCGADAFATSYRARDRRTGALESVAVVHPWLAEGWIHRRRLVRQLKALAAVAGENVLGVLAASQAQDGSPYWRGPVPEGETLREFVAHRGPLSESLLIEIGDQILAALEQAHARGVLHRALGPDDVFITGDHLPRVRVRGFGLADVFRSARLPSPSAEPGADLLARAAFLPPEEFLDEPADVRGDLYGAGALLYFMATGASPIVIERAEDVVAAVIRRSPLPPRAHHATRGLSSAAEGVLLQALAKYPEDRFESASEMRAALRARPSVLTPELKPRERERRRPRPPIGARTLLATGGVAGALALISLLIPEMTAAAKPRVEALNLPSGPVAETRYTLRGQAHLRSGQTLLLDDSPVPVGDDGHFAAELPVPPGSISHVLQVRGSDGSSAREPIPFAITGFDQPALDVVEPTADFATRRDSVKLRLHSDRELSSAAVDDQALALAGNDAEGSIRLRPGRNTLRVSIVDRYGRASEDLIAVERLVAPVITITAPVAGAHVARALCAGQIEGAAGLRVLIDGQEVPAPGGRFELELSSADGSFAPRVQVLSDDGVEAETSVAAVLDRIPPRIEARDPAVSSGAPVVSGTVVDAAPGEVASLSVNGQPVPVGADGSFQLALADLAEGTREVTVRALDRAGNETLRLVPVTVDRTPPSLTLSDASPGVLIAHEPHLAVRLRVTDQHPARVIWQNALGERGETKAGSDGLATVSLPVTPGTNRYSLWGVDAAGLESAAQEIVCYSTPAAQVSELHTDLVERDGTKQIAVAGTATQPLWRAEVNSVAAAVHGNRFEATIPINSSEVLVILWDRAGGRAEHREPIRPEAALKKD